MDQPRKRFVAMSLDNLMLDADQLRNRLEGKTLNVAIYKGVAVSTFETYFPEEIEDIASDHDPHPPSRRISLPAWHKEGYEYHAYLPRDRSAALGYHVFSSLGDTRVVAHDGRFQLSEDCVKIWSLLEANLTHSIKCISSMGILVSLWDSEPPEAVQYGYQRGHKTLKGLEYCLKKCKHAFLFRWAYLVYLLSFRSRGARMVDIPPWATQIADSVHYAWVDSLWDAVEQQIGNKNFRGTVLCPADRTSVRWVENASRWGVPIWVSWPRGPDDYKRLDGSHVVSHWCPTDEQVIAAKTPRPPTTSLVEPDENFPLSTGSTKNPPPLAPSAPTLPRGSQLIPSWEDFFENREKADRKAEETATPTEKQQWNSRRDAASKYQIPGARGPRVYTWRPTDDGNGYIRELVDRGDVDNVWEDYSPEQMVFHPRGNVWDLCPMRSRAAGDDEMDELNEDGEAFWQVLDSQLSEPVPVEDATDLAFLYRRYGFLTIEATTTLDGVRQLDKQSARRITGLKAKGLDEGLSHINAFITSVLQGRLPDGHCDLTPTSPQNEQFSSSSLGVPNRVSRADVPDLGGQVFVCTPCDNSNRILIHDPLTVIEMGRMKVQTYRAAIVDYLLRTGSQFTMLSEETEDMRTEGVHILSFPVRPIDWVSDVEDYQVYMSRLKVFLAQRPHVAAAALAQGGIAWRLAREAIGLDIDLVLNGAFFNGQCFAVNVADPPQWAHYVNEGEWFFLVGGYNIWTGKGSQTQDISWWPKVNAWRECGLDVKSWSPLCENWFQQRLANINSGKAHTMSSKSWVKNLRYEKDTKKFLGQFKTLGNRFLADRYPNLSAQ